MATPKNLSVIKAQKILDSFRRFNQPVSLKMIASAAGLSLAATHRLVATLEHVGVLRTDTNGRYLLSAKIAELGDQARRMAAPQALLNTLVETVSKTVGETAHVAILNKDMAKYVAKSETARGLRTVTQVGKELEAYCTGVGKVLLAFSSVSVRKRYLMGGDFVQLTDKTISDNNALKAELSKIRAAGYAVDNEEFEEGLKCVAVPILNKKGKMVASLSISGPSSRIDRMDLPRLVSQLQQYARQIGGRVPDSDWSYM